MSLQAVDERRRARGDRHADEAGRWLTGRPRRTRGATTRRAEPRPGSVEKSSEHSPGHDHVEDAPLDQGRDAEPVQPQGRRDCPARSRRVAVPVSRPAGPPGRRPARRGRPWPRCRPTDDQGGPRAIAWARTGHDVTAMATLPRTSPASRRRIASGALLQGVGPVELGHDLAGRRSARRPARGRCRAPGARSRSAAGRTNQRQHQGAQLSIHPAGQAAAVLAAGQHGGAPRGERATQPGEATGCRRCR